ncbi:proline racemase family protein [Shewanella electrodiphila]|uniref:Proline racemase family protein n=1 Tax=Shewanella electrodiphila TaxID=934143 RepID=A0ABT0KPA5_9GAMM|nr:proline racemase family protein [Shewanella electrodiphila]MCL1045534.1 proline racemase family protein [Shewanella electrodiphila]
MLMHEPRIHAGMHGALLTFVFTEGADFKVLFMRSEGGVSMCGLGVLALVKVTGEAGAIALEAEPRVIRIDAPAGLITATARRDSQGRIHASFLNVASRVDSLGCSVMVEGFGEVEYDIGFGGAYYAYVDA